MMNRAVNYTLLQNTTLLFVDDEKTIMSVLVPILKKFFKEVHIAMNGLEAFEFYKKNHKNIDLILSDYDMPVMNGLDLLEGIRRINDEIPFVFLSAYLEEDILLKCIELDVSYFAKKPANVKDILYYISKATETIHTKKLLQGKKKEIDEYIKIIDQIAIISKTDTEGNITFVNDIFCEVAGYEREELIGKHHNIVRHPDMPSSIFKGLWNSVKNGKIWKGKVKNRTKDGESYTVNATVFPIIDDEDDSLTGYMAVRFLTTEDELKAKAFKSQVMQQVIEFRTKKLELDNIISSLQFENFKLKNTEFKDKRLFDEIEKNKKLNQQLSHYEKKLLDNQNNYDIQIGKARERVISLDEENRRLKNLVQKNATLVYDNENIINNLKNDLVEAQSIIKELKLKREN